MKIFTIFFRFWGKNQFLLVNFWDPIFKTLFPKQFFVFSTLDSKMSKNMCKLRRKVRNDQNLAYDSPDSTNYWFQSNVMYNFGHVFTSLRPHYQNIFF